MHIVKIPSEDQATGVSHVKNKYKQAVNVHNLQCYGRIFILVTIEGI
jgi:hypothetical protein